MAVATPVLENTISEEEKLSRSQARTEQDNKHNAGISGRFATLINPNSRLEDLLPRADVSYAENGGYVEEKERPYLVENARADSALFRADSAINARPETEMLTVPAASPSTEEEDEDLRPTLTTIQYRTAEQDKKRTAIKSTTDRRTNILGKKEKMIIAVFIGIVVALLALVIINSAVIANLNEDIKVTQENIATVKGALAGVNSNIVEMLMPTNK